MDYSLLVGVKRKAFTVMNHQQRNGSSINRTSTINGGSATPTGSYNRFTDLSEINLHGTIPAAVVEGPELYSFAVIDILQEWNWSKKIEHLTKVWLKCAEPHGISAVPAWEYSARFLRAVAQDSFQEYYPEEDEALLTSQISSVASVSGQGGTTSYI